MEAEPRFEIGRVYERAEIHAEYGGQEQGGISTPSRHPLVFLITGEVGLQYGYKDYLDDEGIFYYYGEGTTGNMEFSSGNKAIRDHAQNEEELHLFKRLRPKYLRYLGEKVCSGFEWITDDDTEGKPRQAIVFQLVPADRPLIATTPLPPGVSLADLAALADADPTEEGAPKDGVRKTYARSSALRAFVRARADGSCEGCGAVAPFTSLGGEPYLEAHHTHRRSDAGPGNRKTVIALCPNCHSRVHYGKDGDSYNEKLKAKLSEIESAF